ncbi:MAG: hypothetical protein IKD91_06400 [Clostridiales bacterium]|nr:hypothetical protein [Clostridiales bacterium]
MANTGRSRSSGSSAGSKRSPAKKPARSNTSRGSSSRRTSAPMPEETGFAAAFNKFATSKAATPLIFIAAVILIVGIDLLISWNKFELFFKILGIEILIAVVVWIILTLVFSGKKNKDPDGGPAEDGV